VSFESLTKMNRKAVIYARVSSVSDRQSTARQVEDLTTYAGKNDYEVVRTFEEKASGARDDRPILAECVKFCLDGNADNLFVSEISRLGRTIKIIVDTIDSLTKAKVNVFIQDINTNTLLPSGEENPLAGILVIVMGQVAAIERKNIANRLHSGREIAKAKGVHFGRRKGQVIKTHEDKEREYSKVLRDLRQGLSVVKVAKIHSVSESTVKRLKKEFEIESK